MQNDEKALSWLCKIEEVKMDLAKVKKTIDEYNAFLAVLNPQEQIVMRALVMNRYRVDVSANDHLFKSRSCESAIKNTLVTHWLIMFKNYLYIYTNKQRNSY
jgi:hypothetical protein